MAHHSIRIQHQNDPPEHTGASNRRAEWIDSTAASPGFILPILLALALALWLLTACAPVAPVTSEPSVQTDSERLQTESLHPTLADFWAGRARFRVDVEDTGLPMGESDTLIVFPPDELSPDAAPRLWSYIHASYQSLGVIDQCGDPVEFPGCMVIFESNDGERFGPRPVPGLGDDPVRCQMPCLSCPCTTRRDHIDQQQYPRVQRHTEPPDAADPFGSAPAETWLMVYEYRANILLRRSNDGLHWSAAEELPLTGIWQSWLMPCPARGAIGPHPFTPQAYDCLVGSPPGLYIDSPARFSPLELEARNPENLFAVQSPDDERNPEVYIFVGLGQNPGAMGCYRGRLHTPAAHFQHCRQNPLFVAGDDYGPLDDTGPETNPFFDFRTISSADVIRVGSEYYMLYEGVRGPEAGAAGDTQFTLAMARTTGGAIDGPWETYPGNPILVDMPGNVGVGHADLLVMDGITYLYTSLDGTIRSRLVLEWQE